MQSCVLHPCPVSGVHIHSPLMQIQRIYRSTPIGLLDGLVVPLAWFAPCHALLLHKCTEFSFDSDILFLMSFACASPVKTYYLCNRRVIMPVALDGVLQSRASV
jgi:hypothetical protein